MEILQAINIANELMQHHGLIDKGWRFEMDRAKRRFGVCKYRSKQITLSTDLTALNEEKEVRNTILHEIAHALVGPRHGHDAVWKAKAIEIGCTGDRCYGSHVIKPKGNYESVCPKCKTTKTRHKKPKRDYSCGDCSKGSFKREFLLIWKKVTK